MNDRFDVEHALRASASTPTPAPDRGFVDGLERRLASGAMAGNVLPFARRARRLSAGVVVAGSLVFAGVAAAAGIAVTHPFAHDVAPAPSTGASGSAAVVATEPPATTAVAVTVHATLPVTLPVTVPRTDPVTLPVVPTTVVHLEPVPTTEVKVAATMSLACVVVAGPAVQCTWSEGPAGTAYYDVLRSDGHAFVNIEHTLTWTDTAPPVGPVSYLVHAMSPTPGSVSLAHSGSVAVSCC